MMNLVFLGNTKYSIIGAGIIYQKHPLSAVVTIPDKPVGREKTLTPSPVKSFALKNNIPVLEAERLGEKEIQKIAEFEPDFLIVEDYGLILPKALLDLPKFAPINIHHSLLPKYRGPSPAPTAILNGDKISGVSIIKMTEEVDCGDILAQIEYELTEDETSDSLLIKLNQMGGELALEVIEKYQDIKLTPQDWTKVIFTEYITKQDGYFDINNPPDPEKLDRMIRAYFPWPNVWTKWEGKIVKFLPGGLIQMEGKKPVPLKDFLNGYPEAKVWIEKIAH